jgi:hypothetical protein
MSQKLGDISSGDLTEWLSARGLSSETCDALACAGLGGATLLELCEDDLADEELGLEPDEIAKLLELIVAAQQARDDDDEDGDGGDADGEASALAIGGSFGTLLSVGLVCFDITMIIAELPHADSKMRAQRSVHGAGGNAANTCVACCRLAPAGLAPHKKVRLLTRLGDDALAAQVCWCVLVCVCARVAWWSNQDLASRGFELCRRRIRRDHASCACFAYVYVDVVYYLEGSGSRLGATSAANPLLR